MTTSQSLILRRKSGAYIDLSSAPYAIGRNFAIPSLAETTVYASGSSANVYGGGILSSVKYDNRVWVFEIRILATTDAAIRSAEQQVTDFLKSNSPRNTGYIEYRPNTDTPAPLWGQYGSVYRYEIVNATTDLNTDYADGTLRAKTAWLTITAVIKPFAETLQQLACTATGGVSEDLIGAANGLSRGLIVPLAVTNKMTNPVFGHGTFGNGWTAGASLIAAKNSEQKLVIPNSDTSARLMAISATNNTYTQSIAAGNTNKHSLSCYARLPDDSAISATQIQLYYNAALTTTYTSLGGGWYWLRSENFDGIAAAATTGVLVKNGYTVLVTGFQLEERAYATRPAWGDLLGCAWTGTAHDSTSTRTAASCKLPISNSIINASSGSVRVVVRFDVANTFPDDMLILDVRDGTHTNSLAVYFDSGTDQIYLVNGGTEIIGSGALTFAANATYVIHATWDASGIALYINGVSAGSVAYTVSTIGANLFIGSDYSSTAQFQGVIAGVATSDRAFTSAQVLADYTNIAPLLTDYRRVDAIPWFWTDDGDNILSLDTGKTPLGIVAGVPGTLPAVTEIQGALSSNWSTIKSIALSSYACTAYLGLATFLYDYNGTALAGDYGGNHLTTTVDTTGAGETLSPANPTRPSFIADQLNGMEYYGLARLFGSAATQFYLTTIWQNSSVVNTSTQRAITPAAGTAYRMFHTNSNKIGFNTDQFANILSTQISFYIYGAKIATNVDISVDYLAIMPRPCLFITGGSEAVTGFAVRGFSAYHSGSGFNGHPLVATGDVIEFHPNKLNHVQCYFCVDETVDPAITYQATLSAIYVTPRWALL